MLIGIDVGGTFTDGVLFNGNSVIGAVKRPTDNQDLQATLLQVLDELLVQCRPADINRIVLSTTLVTNMLATDNVEKTALMLLPGPGLPLDSYRLFGNTYFVKGSIDFRGRKTEAIDRSEIKKTAELVHAEGIRKIAIVGKFSNRNSELEKEARKIIWDLYPEMEVVLGSETAGQLNFRRRMVTTYYSVMTQSAWEKFIGEIEKAIEVRGIKAEIAILKADGGTMPLNLSRYKPCETVFSGPAASTMGAVALVMQPRNTVVLDIGGTTSDISLLIEGRPLYASKGAKIGGHYTHISAFSVCSLPLGGDSPVIITPGELTVGTRRKGSAACFGGDQPTVTDIFNHKYSLGIGDQAQSSDKLKELLQGSTLGLEELCTRVEDIVLERLQQAIGAMLREWENEPAYRVWEVVHGRKFNVQDIIGIGAASHAIVPRLAERMQVEYTIPAYAAVANALGACVARPTLALKVHIDTENGYYVLDQTGAKGEVNPGRGMQLQEAKALARQHLEKMAQANGIDDYADEAEFYLEEQFNVIRGWNTAGKIFDIGIQISPGFIKEYQGVSK